MPFSGGAAWVLVSDICEPYPDAQTASSAGQGLFAPLLQLSHITGQLFAIMCPIWGLSHFEGPRKLHALESGTPLQTPAAEQVPHKIGHDAAKNGLPHAEAPASWHAPGSGMPLHTASVWVDVTLVAEVAVVVVRVEVELHVPHRTGQSPATSKRNSWAAGKSQNKCSAGWHDSGSGLSLHTSVVDVVTVVCVKVVAVVVVCVRVVAVTVETVVAVRVVAVADVVDDTVVCVPLVAVTDVAVDVKVVIVEAVVPVAVLVALVAVAVDVVPVVVDESVCVVVVSVLVVVVVVHVPQVAGHAFRIGSPRTSERHIPGCSTRSV